MPLVAVTLPALVAPAPSARAVAGCQMIAPRFARGAATDARPHPLAQEPRANVTLALYREVAGCSAPVVVRYGIGADANAR